MPTEAAHALPPDLRPNPLIVDLDRHFPLGFPRRERPTPTRRLTDVVCRPVHAVVLVVCTTAVGLGVVAAALILTIHASGGCIHSCPAITAARPDTCLTPPGCPAGDALHKAAAVVVGVLTSLGVVLFAALLVRPRSVL
jgi:hypothetical protein